MKRGMKPTIAVMLGHEPDGDEEEDGEDYDVTPELEGLAKDFIRAVHEEDAAGMVKAFCAMQDAHGSREEEEDSEREEREAHEEETGR